MQVIYKPEECCSSFLPLTVFIWEEISDNKYIEFLCHKKIGIFRQVWQCPCYKTKPSGLFKHQFIQHFCGFLIINFVRTASFFTSGYCFFFLLSPLWFTDAKKPFHPYCMCFGQLPLFCYSDPKERFISLYLILLYGFTKEDHLPWLSVGHSLSPIAIDRDC